MRPKKSYLNILFSSSASLSRFQIMIVFAVMNDHLSYGTKNLIIGTWETWMQHQKYNFQSCFADWHLYLFLHNVGMKATGLNWWYVNVASCNGLVPLGNKPMSETMLTQTFVDVWRRRHYATTC